MTIEIPTPSAELISQLETATIETSQSEAAAVSAIRERFTPYAKHNGFVMTADYDLATSNYSVDRNAHYERDGKRVRALLAEDSFSIEHTDQNRGTRGGTKLYLTQHGEWLQIERVGRWTQWQGEAQYWYTDDVSRGKILGNEFDGYDGDDGSPSGAIAILADAEVAAKYDVDNILNQIGRSMAELCKKLPARYAKLQQRAELARRVIAAATEAK